MTKKTVALEGIELHPHNACPGALRPLEDELDAYVTRTLYDVAGWYFGEEDEYIETVVGQLQAERVLLGQALNQRVSRFDIMDAHSQDLCDIYSLMFDEQGRERDSFEAAVGFDVTSSDLCYVATDSILDHSWGPTALHILVQHSDAGFVIVGVSGLHAPQSAKHMTTALQRAAKLETMGFVRVEDSPYFFLNTAYILKPLTKALSLPKRTKKLHSA